MDAPWYRAEDNFSHYTENSFRVILPLPPLFGESSRMSMNEAMSFGVFSSFLSFVSDTNS
jgi:hypothetical protein